MVFLLKWIEAKSVIFCGIKKTYGFDLKVSFKQPFPVYRGPQGYFKLYLIVCVLCCFCWSVTNLFYACTIPLGGSCYIFIRKFKLSIRSAVLLRDNQLFYVCCLNSASVFSLMKFNEMGYVVLRAPKNSVWSFYLTMKLLPAVSS